MLDPYLWELSRKLLVEVFHVCKRIGTNQRHRLLRSFQILGIAFLGQSHIFGFYDLNKVRYMGKRISWAQKLLVHPFRNLWRSPKGTPVRSSSTPRALGLAFLLWTPRSACLPGTCPPFNPLITSRTSPIMCVVWPYCGRMATSYIRCFHNHTCGCCSCVRYSHGGYSTNDYIITPFYSFTSNHYFYQIVKLFFPLLLLVVAGVYKR